MYNPRTNPRKLRSTTPKSLRQGKFDRIYKIYMEKGSKTRKSKPRVQDKPRNVFMGEIKYTIQSTVQTVNKLEISFSRKTILCPVYERTNVHLYGKKRPKCRKTVKISEQEKRAESEMYLHGQVPTVNTREESGVLRRPFVMDENRLEITKFRKTKLQKFKFAKPNCKTYRQQLRTNAVISSLFYPLVSFD